MLTYLCVFSQPAIKWQHKFGGTDSDRIGDDTNYYDSPDHAVVRTTDGGFVFCGYTLSNDGDALGNHGGSDFLVVKTDVSGNKLWSYVYGGSGNDQATSVIQTSDGGYAVAGFSNSNDGDFINSHGNDDVVILKLDSNGLFQWSKLYGGSQNDRTYSFLQNPDGSYVIGALSDSYDGDLLINQGYWDYWVFKIDSTGNVLWNRNYGGSSFDWLNSVRSTTDNGYVLCGWSQSSDGDVSFSHGLGDFWIVKIDSLGNMQWEQTYGGSLNERGTCIIQNLNGNYTICGISESADGQITNNQGGNDFWIISISSTGSLIWEKSIGGTGTDEAYELLEDSDQGIVIAGTSNSTNGDVIGALGSFDYFIVKLKSDGDLLWRKSLGGSLFDWSLSVILLPDGDYLISGSSKSYNFYSSPSIGNFDLWLVRLTSNFNIISGTAFVDNNNNTVFDSGDQAIPHKIYGNIIANQFGFTDTTGKYTIQVLDSGSYSISSTYIDYYTAIPSFNTANFSGLNQIDSLNDFAYQATNIVNDLCISIAPVGRFRPGFDAEYLLTYTNTGTTTLTPTVYFFADSLLTFISSVPTANFASNDSAIWYPGAISPFQTGTIRITVNVNSSTPIGTLLNSFALIEPIVGDANPSCNRASWEVLVTGSLDPNDKAVSISQLSSTQLSDVPVLNYLIRFQNTGSDTAFNVMVRDTISSMLDITSLNIVSSSHPLFIEFDSLFNALYFHFQNIFLPDSFTNEPLSHGYVQYSLKPFSNLNLGDTIKNTAGIYFDFNLPVITNSVITTIVSPLSINKKEENLDISVFPNPSTGNFNIVSISNRKILEIELSNYLGQVVVKNNYKGNKNISLNLNALVNGVYLLKISTEYKIFTQQICIYQN